MNQSSDEGEAGASMIDQRRASDNGAAPVTDLDSMRQALNARYLTEISRRVDATLENPLLSNPGWNILLDLFVHRSEGKPIGIIDLCIAANTPTSTALRYVQAMLDSGVIIKIQATDESQQLVVQLSDATYSAMRSILS